MRLISRVFYFKHNFNQLKKYCAEVIKFILISTALQHPALICGIILLLQKTCTTLGMCHVGQDDLI